MGTWGVIEDRRARGHEGQREAALGVFLVHCSLFFAAVSR